VVYENIIFEKLLELKQLGQELDKLSSENNNLEARLKTMAHKLENAEMENSHLKELFVKANVELNLVESVNDQLTCQISNEREMLSQKEKVLLETAKTFHALHTEKKELQRTAEDLKVRYEDAKGKLEEQANQIFKLSSDKDRQSEELGCLYEANQKLESEMKCLHQELEETKVKEKKLSHEVHERMNEIEQWETQAAALYAELQISVVHETLFEGKASELADTCEDLEHINNSKDMESEQLKELVSKLQGENGRLYGQLAAYVPAIGALNDCVTSLEMQTLGHAKHHSYEKPEVLTYYFRWCIISVLIFTNLFIY
jgi:chromosome segregation ATPase